MGGGFKNIPLARRQEICRISGAKKRAENAGWPKPAEEPETEWTLRLRGRTFPPGTQEYEGGKVQW